jgi:hypothetical protein
MNPVYGEEEIESVTEYIASGGWIMEHTKTIYSVTLPISSSPYTGFM